MQFISLQPFVPSGRDFEKSKLLFQELGFRITWSENGYAGFERDGCRFILQHFDDEAFAQNFMVSVAVSSVEEFYQEVMSKKLSERFGIKLKGVTQRSHGKVVDLIDIAGVCWHFVE